MQYLNGNRNIEKLIGSNGLKLSISISVWGTVGIPPIDPLTVI